MHAAVAGLAAGSPPPVQIGACRALAQLCQKARREELGGVAQQMFAGLCKLLPDTTGGWLPGRGGQGTPALLRHARPLLSVALTLFRLPPIRTAV